MKKGLLVTFLLSLLTVSTSFAQPLPATQTHLWNLQNADIRAVIDAIAKQTNKNFVVDPRVQGKISIVSTTPIGPKAAYQLFLAALQVLGYSAVPGPGAIKIVPNLDARSLATPLATAADPGSGDELVARVIPVRYISAIQLVPILRPLMSQWSNIDAYPPSNVVIISGRAANVSRIAQIIAQVDRPENDEIEVISLHHAIASKLVDSLQNLQNSDRALGKISNVSLAADDESNKILMSGNPAERLKFRVLISELDSASGEGGNAEVVHLNYISAKKLAPVLSAISKTVTTTSNTPNSTAASQIAIKDDDETNSIIISAPRQILQTMLNVVHALDQPPAQVLVEAVFAQVNESVINQLGISWSAVENQTTTSSDGGDSNSTTSLLQFPGIGIIKSHGINGGTFNGLITALRNNSSSDILSTPSIVVANNQKADISAGVNIGMLNREYSTNNTNQDGDDTPYNTYERKDVGLSLKVTPQISPSGRISLKITQTNDSLQNPSNPGDNPIFNTNKIDTTVVVNNGDILVLGGLIDHKDTKGESKVPILGDLPLIGRLFRYDNHSIDKENLMVFIRPVILHNGETAREITEHDYNYLRKLQLLKSRGISIITNITEPPLLQPLVTPKAELPSPFVPKQ